MKTIKKYLFWRSLGYSIKESLKVAFSKGFITIN